MSAYGQGMDREYSSRSLSARTDSERESQYSTEAGIFMSSFAATIFISGLVVFGISALSSLVALTVMLKSCESRNSGVVEMVKSTRSYDYCRNLALHAELNQLGVDAALPAACKDINIRYIKDGQYVRDLNAILGIVEEFFGSARLQSDGQDVVMMDADDLLASEDSSFVDLSSYWIDKSPVHDIHRGANYLKCVFSIKLYEKLQSTGWQLILFSRRIEEMRNTTIDDLKSAGCHGWSSLIMRSDIEMQLEFQDFLSEQRSMLRLKGFRIMAVISSQMDALAGPRLSDRVFKLPNAVFKYSMGEHFENKIQEG